MTLLLHPQKTKKKKKNYKKSLLFSTWWRTLQISSEDQVHCMQEYTNLEQEYHFEELSVADIQVLLHPAISLLQ